MKTRTLILSILTCLCACTNYDGEISDLQKEIDAIKNDKISTINDQVKNIQKSISELETYKAGLDGYIKDLQAQDKLLKEAIEEVKDNLGDLTALETRLASVEGTLATLQGLYETLDGKIADLKKYVNDELSKAKEWANATFCTLEQYNGVADAITAINSSITLINKTLEEMEKSVEGIDSKIATAISTAKSELEASWKDDIEASATALETSLKAWVNSQLAGYYTAAEADAKIALAKQELERELASQKEALESQIDELKELLGGGSGSGDPETIAELRSKISELQQKLEELTESYAEDIAKLQSDLAAAKQEITEAYQSAIQTAITENNGLIDSKIASSISEANAALSAQITEISSKLEALVGRVDALETQVSDIKSKLEGILSMIQSITVVPDYSNGYVKAKYGNVARASFEIFPISAAEALAGNWSEAVSLRAVYTEPATKSAYTFVDLPVNNVAYADGIVTVTYDSRVLSDEFWSGAVTANARLLISDSNNCVASQYYSLRPVLPDFSSAEDLSAVESANCYIVSSEGTYKFKTVKGNSDESVGSVATCEVLWETFGTSTAPQPGDLIPLEMYKDGYVYFASDSKKGNAVIAARDASGNILWSWHIWLADEPESQEYNNNAGVMMDRNLGATSATPGDVGALGLLYQWGRKDPFLGFSSISEGTVALSTITWPSAVTSDSSTGTIGYAIANPTTFIKCPTGTNGDWYYTGDSSKDQTRWQSTKTIYDPCPAGWRIPGGGSKGVWATAFGTSSSWTNASNWDSTNMGYDLSVTDKTLGYSGPIWYPAAGYIEGINRGYSKGSGLYYADKCQYMILRKDGYITPSTSYRPAAALSVRCLQE